MRNQADSRVVLRAANGKGREILDAAAEMFLVRGYERTTISDIAGSVGLLPSSIYHYARSKEEMLYTIARITHDENADLLDVTTYEATRAVDRLEEFIVRNLTYIAEHPAYVVTFDLEYRHLSHDHRNEINALRRQFRSFLTHLVRDGQADGDITSTIDPKLTAIAMLSLLNSVARWYSVGREWSVKELVDVHCRLLMDGARVTRAVPQARTTGQPGGRRPVGERARPSSPGQRR